MADKHATPDHPIHESLSDFVFTGQSASLTFPDAGVYSYNCALHPNMKGAVEVTK